MRLKADNLGFHISNKQIISEVTVDFKEKEFVGIIGPNGSGKSTFLKCLYRVLQPKTGKVLVNNQDINNYPYKESAQKTAVVAQQSSGNLDFSVKEIVLMGRSPYKGLLEKANHYDDEIAGQNIKLVGMEDFQDTNFAFLSGGEQQRVILARALTQTPECLILDEPTNHLDIKYQLEILTTVKNSGKTVIAAIHDLNMACMYCDRLIALKNGKIVGDDTPENLINPTFMKFLFGVDAEILKLSDKRLFIAYKVSAK
jgi:iron complex transport system ATP-binding protein